MIGTLLPRIERALQFLLRAEMQLDKTKQAPRVFAAVLHPAASNAGGLTWG